METEASPQEYSPRGERDGESPQNANETAEEREAFEYWGYLFKSDKTGTDKLKSLLRGLKNLMNEKYEPAEHPGQPEPDLTPPPTCALLSRPPRQL